MTTWKTGGRARSRRVPWLVLGLLAGSAAVAACLGFLAPRGDHPAGAGGTGPAVSAFSPVPDSQGGVADAAPATPSGDGVALPAGTGQVAGYPTGFPPVDLGAVAVQAALTRAQIGFDYAQAVRVAGVYAAPDARQGMVDRARAAVGLRRGQAGVPARGAVPAPASYALTPVAFTVEELRTGLFAVDLLSYVTLTRVDGTTGNSLYAGAQLLGWVEGDWKVVQGSDADLARLRAQQPAVAVPGTRKFARARWTVIRGEYR